MEDRRDILTVRQLNERISDAVRASFPATVWVKGEIQRLPSDAARRSHVYFELHETGASGAAEYQIPAGIMGWDRQKFGLARYLDGSDPDLQLANKLEVCLEAQVDFYAKFGKLSLKIVGVDKSYALGQLEARRREVLAFLEKEGLLELNRTVSLPEVPLHVGLVTSVGSAAERDFLTGLEQSGWAFRVESVGAKMQGERVQAEVVAALDRLENDGVEVIVITRGGGSRADLSWFDQQDLAVAIARCPVPVVTAIGHEIDTSIADLVAHHICKTPTAAAEFLVDRVDLAAGRVEDGTERLLDAVGDLLGAAQSRLEVARQLGAVVDRGLLSARLRVQRTAGRLQQTVGRRLTRANARLATRAADLGAVATARSVKERRRLAECGRRLASEAPRAMRRRAVRLEALGKQVELMDPARLLARGYSITLGPEGKALVRAKDAGPGTVLTTRLAEGELRSVVQPKDTTRTAKRRTRKKTGEEPGQGDLSLF
ncbi:MAG: exodeoxyribonuclease VII large subunit [bacterium]|nr:exodeoxyribonuclease VII large subunit [bacterium]